MDQIRASPHRDVNPGPWVRAISSFCGFGIEKELRSVQQILMPRLQTQMTSHNHFTWCWPLRRETHLTALHWAHSYQAKFSPRGLPERPAELLLHPLEKEKPSSRGWNHAAEVAPGSLCRGNNLFIRSRCSFLPRAVLGSKATCVNVGWKSLAGNRLEGSGVSPAPHVLGAPGRWASWGQHRRHRHKQWG